MPIVLNGCLNITEVTVALVASSDCFSYAFTELPSGIPHVQKLSMELVMETKMQDYTKCPTMFLNLRHLVLTMEIFRHYEILVVYFVLLTFWSWLQFWNNWNCTWSGTAREK